MTALLCTPENIKKQIVKAKLSQPLKVTYRISADACTNRIKVMSLPDRTKRQHYVKAFKGNSVEELSEKISSFMLSLEHRRIFNAIQIYTASDQGNLVYFAEVAYLE